MRPQLTSSCVWMNLLRPFKIVISKEELLFFLKNLGWNLSKICHILVLLMGNIQWFYKTVNWYRHYTLLILSLIVLLYRNWAATAPQNSAIPKHNHTENRPWVFAILLFGLFSKCGSTMRQSSLCSCKLSPLFWSQRAVQMLPPHPHEFSTSACVCAASSSSW